MQTNSDLHKLTVPARWKGEYRYSLILLNSLILFFLVCSTVAFSALFLVKMRYYLMRQRARYTGGVEVAGSNPVSPTFFQSRKHAVFNRLMFKRATLQGELRGDFTS